MEIEERLVAQIRIWHKLNFKREEPKDLKAIKENLKPKMGFLVLAKHDLNKTWI